MFVFWGGGGCIVGVYETYTVNIVENPDVQHEYKDIRAVLQLLRHMSSYVIMALLRRRASLARNAAALK